MPASRIAVLVCVAAALAAGVSAQDFPLQPFTKISICTPFSILIEPSRGGAYQIGVAADDGVADAVNATVAGGTLTLATKTGNSPTQRTFSAPNPIHVAVR